MSAGTRTPQAQPVLTPAPVAGAVPSFRVGGARSGYALAHLVPRTSKLADLLQLEQPAWLRAAAVQAAAHAMSGGEAISIAGGPGYDLAALALVQSFGRLPLPRRYVA